MCVQGHAVGGCLQGCVPADAGGVVNLSGLQGRTRGHRNMQGVCRGMQQEGVCKGVCPRMQEGEFASSEQRKFAVAGRAATYAAHR